MLVFLFFLFLVDLFLLFLQCASRYAHSSVEKNIHLNNTKVVFNKLQMLHNMYFSNFICDFCINASHVYNSFTRIHEINTQHSNVSANVPTKTAATADTWNRIQLMRLSFMLEIRFRMIWHCSCFVFLRIMYNIF